MIPARGRFPNPVGRSRVERTQIRRIKSDHERAFGRIRNALNLLPMQPGVIAAVNARAGAREDLFGVRWVHREAEHIGIVNHPVMNGHPILAAVSGFPREMKRSGIDDFGISWINGNRIEISQLGIVRGCN